MNMKTNVYLNKLLYSRVRMGVGGITGGVEKIIKNELAGRCTKYDRKTCNHALKRVKMKELSV